MTKAAVGVILIFSIAVNVAASDGNEESQSRELEGRPKMLPHDSGRKLIEGVPKLLWGGPDSYTDGLMVSSALRLCLDYIGEEYSKAYLAGTSGAAFDIGWARSGIHSAAGGAIFAHPNHFEAGMDNLLKAIGRKYTIATMSEPQRLWDVVVQSIDAGCPVVAVEWAIEHFAVLAGYDPDERD